MPNPFSLIQDPSLTRLSTDQRKRIVNDLEAFLKMKDLPLTAPKPEVTTPNGDRILEGSTKIFHDIDCQAQVHLQKEAQWFIACFRPQGDWNFGKCFPNMQGMPQQPAGLPAPATPPANSAGTFLLCNATMSNPLWVYISVNRTTDKATLESALKELTFWKNWTEKDKDKLLGELSDFGKQTSLYLWGNFPQLPEALKEVFSLLNQSFSQTILRGEVYRPNTSLAEQKKSGQVQTFVPGFPVLRLELPLAKTDNLFDPKVSGELDLVLTSPLYYTPGNSFIGLKGEVKITAGSEILDVSLEVDYPIGGDTIIAIGKFKDSKIPFADPSLFPNGMPAAKQQQLELDLILQFSKAQKKLKSIEFDVDLQNWQLFDNKLTLSDLRFSFYVYDPTGMKAVMASIDAVARLGKKQDIELSAGGNYPGGQLYLSVNTQNHSLRTVLPDLGLTIDDPSHIPDLIIRDFRVEYNVLTSQFYAGIDLAGPWKIHDGITLENFQFHVAGGQGNLGLNLSAGFNLDNIPIALSASYASSGSGVAKTSGWSFRGRASNIPLGNLIQTIAKEFTTAVELPEVIKQLYIYYLEISFTQSTSTDFKFSCELKYPKDGKKADLTLTIQLTKTPPTGQVAGKVQTKKPTDSFHVVVAGKLLVANKEFDVDLDLLEENNITTDLLIAKADKVDIDLKDLAGSLIEDETVQEFIPPIIISPKYALIARVKDTTQGSTLPASKTLTGLDLDLKIDLKGLPLIGKMLGMADFQVKDLQLLYASDNLSLPEVQELNKSTYLPSKFPEQPADGMSTNPDAATTPAPATPVILSKGLGFKATVLLGTFAPFQLDMPARPQRSQVAGNGTPSTNTTSSSTQTAGSTSIQGTQVSGNSGTSSPTTGGDATWINIQQAIGPVQFSRIGFQYKNKKIWGYLDVSLGLAGLTLSLDGLGFGNPINKFDPSFTLNGLGIDYRQGPVEIGGSFLRYRVPAAGDLPEYDEYDGMAILKIETFSISAIGSYANIKGHDSLFIYAVLNYPLGGPAFFFVTGVAAGFGYNRAIRMPSITGVAQFPLVNEAVNGAGSGPPADDAARRQYLNTELTRLRTAIYPKAGEYFLAAGIRFSSFEMIDSFAMVSVSFGQHFEVDVLGLSTLVIPTPEAGQTVTPIAEVQLALRAVFNPDQGILAIEAQLTNNSYLFSRACHLTGGFAFYTWFKGEHEGDFVITLGGYHPKYLVPKHYPKVPRLGFNWVLSDVFSIKGEAYFALTAHALMAGGKLEALFHKGGIKAWFIVGADFIISWKPYFYDAKMYMDIGASYTFWLFGTHTIKFELGANLHIWGPDFSGKATIHYYIVSFTISFGDAAGKPKPIEWSTFKTSFLPEDSKICTVTVAGGLIKEEGKRAILNPKDMALSVNSMVPVKTYESLTISDEWKVLHPKPATNFGIAPMDLAEVKESKMTITIEKWEKGKWEPWNSDFAFTPILKRMPRAMWGDALTVETNGEQFIENALAGFEIRPANPSTPGETQFVLKKDLQYEPDDQHQAFRNPELASFSFSGGNPTLSKINEKAANRNELLQSLGLDPGALKVNVPDNLDEIFVEMPVSGAFM